MACPGATRVLVVRSHLMCSDTAYGRSSAWRLRPAALQDELAEAAAVCRLIVAGTLVDVLDAGKRAALPRMDLPRLAAILAKYRRAAVARCSASCEPGSACPCFGCWRAALRRQQ